MSNSKTETAGIPELDFLLAPLPQPEAAAGEVDILLVERAGFLARLNALSIDKFLVWLIISTMVRVNLLLLHYYGISFWQNLHIYAPVMALMGLIVDGAYYVVFIGHNGQTVGKLILGLRVVSDTGKPLSYSQALRRWLGYFVSSFSLGLGYLQAAYRRDKRAWHDLMAHTVVIKL